MEKIVGLKDLRLNVDKYAKEVAKGSSFVVMRQSKPLFKISPVDEEETWETVIDFTKVRKGGVPIEEIIAAIGHERSSKSSRKTAKRI